MSAHNRIVSFDEVYAPPHGTTGAVWLAPLRRLPALVDIMLWVSLTATLVPAVAFGDQVAANPSPHENVPAPTADGIGGRDGDEDDLAGKLLAERVEVVPASDESALAWDVRAAFGPDEQKLWLRSEGGLEEGAADETTGAEVLWWRALLPGWATLVGVRQDFGLGSHTSLVFGIEGLVPHDIEVEATGYVADGGRLAARLEGSYDLSLSDRLILTPEVESNLYSRTNLERGLASGVGNVELGVRLRYRLTPRVGPFIGVEWDRALGGTAALRRDDGESENEINVIAGVRLWR